MYSETIVLSGPEVMLSSSASVAASHSPRPQSEPIGSAPSAGAGATSRSGTSPRRGAGQLAWAFGMVSVTRQRSPVAARRKISRPARARVDDRVGRDLVDREDEVVQPRPGQPGGGALPGDQAAQLREISPAEHDVQQVAAAVGDVTRP